MNVTMTEKKQVLPNEFIIRIKNQLSSTEADAFLHAHETTPPVSIRLNPSKGIRQPLESAEIPWCKNGYYLNERPVFTLDPLFHAGTYYVQEAGSMLIERLLLPELPALKGATVLDACAAPGGKSTHLLSMLDNDSVVVSNEIIPGRNKTLRYNLAKWGHPHKIVTQTDTASFATSAARFDLILIDAPCSGEGLFRRDPEACNEWSLQQTQQCVQRQAVILDDLVPLLKEGGLLLYSTCTYNPGENDEQIKRVIEQHPFEVITGQPPEGIVATTFGWQAFPHKVKSEGFYCSLLRYTGQEVKPRKIKSTGITILNDKKSNYPEWLKSGHRMNAYAMQQHVFFAGERTHEVMQSLHGLYIREFGVPAGELKGQEIIPSFGLALSLIVNDQLPTINLDEQEALEFLKCGNISASATIHGWHLMCYDTHPIGWAKKIGARWNNYHPKEHRILMDLKSPNKS